MPRSSYESYYELLQKDYELIKRPDTQVVIRDVPTGLPSPELVSYYGLRQANDREILKSMLQAERKGFDAVAGACFSDGAIRAAGNLMNIPVVGPGETSMYLARMMGVRFAIITSDPTPETEHYIDVLGMRAFVIGSRPVRCLTLDPTSFFNCLGGDYGPAVENFEELGQSCIEDGADVLLAGCGLLSPMLTASDVREIDGVPIIDPMQVALKFAEMMVDFRAAGMSAISARGLFLKPSSEDIELALKSLGLV
jgi:allantoin racemase